MTTTTTTQGDDLRSALAAADRLRKAMHAHFNRNHTMLGDNAWLATAFSNAQYDDNYGITSIDIADDGTINAIAEVYTTQTGGSTERFDLTVNLSDLEGV